MKFWICYVEGSSGGQHVKHYSLYEACKEATRLARQLGNRNKKVYVLESHSCCEILETPVTWHKF